LDPIGAAKVNDLFWKEEEGKGNGECVLSDKSWPPCKRKFQLLSAKPLRKLETLCLRRFVNRHPSTKIKGRKTKPITSQCVCMSCYCNVLVDFDFKNLGAASDVQALGQIFHCKNSCLSIEKMKNTHTHTNTQHTDTRTHTTYIFKDKHLHTHAHNTTQHNTDAHHKHKTHNSKVPSATW